MNESTQDINALLDNIINDDIEYVTPEQIQLMSKAKQALNKLSVQVERMDRAGLNTAQRKESIKDSLDKIDKFLREYGTR